MKKLLLFFLLSLAVFAEEKSYYHFEGKIGNADVVLELNILEKNRVEVNYFYSKYGEIISLIGNVDKNKITISNEEESISGVLSNGKFEGSWKKGNTNQNISLTEIYKDSFDIENLKNINMLPMTLASHDDNYINDKTIVYNKGNFIVSKELDYIYSGGAHGNYTVNFKTYDIEAKKLTEYSDIFGFDYNEILISLLLKEAKNRNLKIFKENFFVTNNVYFTDKGICFVYNPYEIASFADGVISLFLPYEKIPKSIVLKNDITKKLIK